MYIYIYTSTYHYISSDIITYHHIICIYIYTYSLYVCSCLLQDVVRILVEILEGKEDIAAITLRLQFQCGFV